MLRFQQHKQALTRREKTQEKQLGCQNSSLLCFHMYKPRTKYYIDKKRCVIFDSGMMTHEESRRMELLQKVPQPSKPTWVSVQDVVLNSLRLSTQPSQLLPELSHFYQTHKHKEMSLLMSLWFLLVCHALTQNDAESPVDIFLSTSQKRSKTHVLTKSLYIKTWFVCLNKFECLKNVETFQAPKHDS